MKCYEISLLLFFCTVSRTSNAKVIGAAIIPHGDFAFSPKLLNDNIGAQKLHTACRRVAQWIMEDMKPDLIFLTTPHGLKLNHNFLVYENDIEEGYAMIGDDLHDPHFMSTKIHLNISTNKPLAHKLVRLLNIYGNKVEGLSSFGSHPSLPLKWAEIVPIKYLEKVNKELPQFIIYSFPKFRSKHFIQDLLYNGYSLWSLLDDERVTGEMDIMIVISADLAHTHYNEHVMPYGHCDCAPLFDRAISQWITTMNSDYLLQTATYQQYSGAKSCGFHGFVLLQGLFDGSFEEDIAWMSQLHANYHPTYYGMAVANFTRI